MAAGSIHNPLRKGMRARELGLKREGGGQEALARA